MLVSVFLPFRFDEDNFLWRHQKIVECQLELGHGSWVGGEGAGEGLQCLLRPDKVVRV